MNSLEKMTRQLARKGDIDPAGGPHAAWAAMARANRIFGPAGWSRETLEMRNAANRERDGQHTSAYVARIRLTVHLPEGPVVRESQGCAEGRGNTPFEAHDQGIKAAELDATLRALATFGHAFGLASLTGKRPGSGARPRHPAGQTGDGMAGIDARHRTNGASPDHGRPV